MKKKLLLFALCIGIFCGARAQIAPVFTNALQYMLDSLGKKHHIKGMSAAVLVPGMGTWKGTTGVSYDGVPLTTDMYLPIGSNTKTFTAAILLKLQENGQLSLDDTIGTWLHNVTNVSGQITVRQLLNHTSGLYSYTDSSGFSAALNADYTKVWQPEDMLQWIGTPSFAPGTGWEYSNTNFLLAGLIIKKILNQPFDATVRSMVLTPQGFNHTVTYPAETPSATVPHGWSINASGTHLEDLQKTYNWDNTAFLSMATSAGAIMSTAEDNVMFWDALMTGKIINNSSLAEMMTSVPINAQAGYGLGVFRYKGINGHNGYCHGGTCFGYINENFRDSVNGICITVLSNQDSIYNNLLFNYVVVPLHKYLLKLPPAGLQEVNAYYDVQLYPNPVSNYLHVKMDRLAEHTKLEVFDMTGRRLISDELANILSEIPVAGLSGGLYIVRISNGEGYQLSRKIEIVK